MQFLNRIRIKTPESVELEFSLAGIGNRSQALTIDYFYLSLALLGVFLIGLSLFFSLSEFWATFVDNEKSLAIWLYAIFSFAFFVIYTGYFVFFESLWRGQTPGKRRANIRVIGEDGRPIGLQQATLRALLRPVDDLLFIGALLIMFGKREKRLGDFVAGTLVVQEEKTLGAANFPISAAARELADRVIQTADLSQLHPDDFAAIREYLQRRSLLLPEAKKEISVQLARQIKQIVALAQLPKGVTADLFLEAVYLAYQQR